VHFFHLESRILVQSLIIRIQKNLKAKINTFFVINTQHENGEEMPSTGISSTCNDAPTPYTTFITFLPQTLRGKDV
jgi:hypothetical protein